MSNESRRSHRGSQYHEMMKAPTTLLSPTCSKCGSQESFLVETEDLHAWRDGAYIQDALHYLTADQREMLISETCGDCWEELFPPLPEFDA